MLKILEFLDFSSIDSQMYWRVKSLDGVKSYEVMWHRDAKIRWRFREVDGLFWTLSDTQNILQDLQKENIDIEGFENGVRMNLIHQACFAFGLLKDSKSLLGDDVVELAIDEHVEFLGHIASILKDLDLQHNQKVKTGLSLVKG